MTPTQLLADLAECLCAAIEASDGPGVCFCGVVPGDGVVADYTGTCSGKNGMAWVRMTSLYPASGVNVLNELPNNCGSAIGMDLEVGMLRIAPQPNARGQMPSASAYTAASSLANDDAITMLSAIRCCEALEETDPTLGIYAPAGPLGGLFGGTWPLAVILG